MRKQQQNFAINFCDGYYRQHEQQPTNGKTLERENGKGIEPNLFQIID
jgi:hypothetical protein